MAANERQLARDAFRVKHASLVSRGYTPTQATIVITSLNGAAALSALLQRAERLGTMTLKEFEQAKQAAIAEAQKAIDIVRVVEPDRAETAEAVLKRVREVRREAK